jgi:UDP-N-acetylmuramoylalanine-D-glutamate ligase
MASKSKESRTEQKAYFERQLKERIAMLKEGGLVAGGIERDNVIKKLRAELRKANARLTAIGAKQKLNEKLAEAKLKKAEEKKEETGKQKGKKGKKAEADTEVSRRQQKKKEKLVEKGKKKEQTEGQEQPQE